MKTDHEKENRVRSWNEPSRQTPVAHEAEVLVVGGGPAGVSAAIAAARAGADTMLVDSGAYFGGMWTLGMQTHATSFHDKEKVIVGGIPREIIDRLVALGAAQDPDEKVKANPGSWYAAFDPEVMKCVLDDMVTEAGVRPLLHTYCVGVRVEDGGVAGIFTESKSGRQAIAAHVTIDCTGDADVAFAAGAPTVKGREGDGKCQPVTLTFMLAGADFEKMGRWATEHPEERERVDREAHERGDVHVPNRVALGARAVTPGVSYHNVTRVLDVDITSAEDLTRAEIEARRQIREVVAFYRQNIPGFENIRLLSMAPSIGLRESRRIVGAYTLTAEDVLASRSFPDGIARQNYYIDVHNPEGAGLEAGTRKDSPEKGTCYEIPYRCLVPREMERLLVAGRCLSATREALGSARVTVCCAQMGQAAGLAASRAVRDGVAVRAVEGDALKASLLKAGAWT